MIRYLNRELIKNYSLPRFLAGISGAISVSRQDVQRKSFLLTMISSQTNFEHVRTFHFHAEFKILHYSDFFYFSVRRKKMVGAKKGLQVVKTVN